MNQNQPLVSVIITVYNGMPYIIDAIEHLQNQTYTNIEIIVVDDGSSDETKKAVEQISKTDNKVRLIKSSRIGRGKALNKAIEVSKGEFLAINDADDFSHKTRIQKQVDFLEANHDYVLVGSKSNLRNLQTGEVTNHSIERPSSNVEIRKYFLKGQPIQHVCVLMRAEAIEKIGGYSEKINFLYDRDLFIRLASNGGKLHNLDEILVDVGHHPTRFFYNTFTGKERIKLDFHYRFEAAKMLNEPFKTRFKLWSLLRWSLLPEGIRKTIKKILKRK
ncbi:glycosyltransferase family 2 protein [Aureibaculum conchae]|uniref:glycosyltransferase family 2 protein n=1 Tax=Aureibaculum sp. 2308TA14-22 TaxID=3108392 RepID=UPI0033943890